VTIILMGVTLVGAYLWERREKKRQEHPPANP
jgi:hypothetical protein